MNTENPICTNCGHHRLAHRIDGTCPMKGQPTKEVWACSTYMEPSVPPEWKIGDELESPRSGAVVRYDGPGPTDRHFTGTVLVSGKNDWIVGHSSSSWVRSFFTPYRSTAEERAKAERIAANAKLKAEWEKEQFPVQFQLSGDTKWIDIDTSVSSPSWKVFNRDGDALRRKPEAVYVPWSFEDQLVGKVVVLECSKERAIIVRQNIEAAFVFGCGVYRYKSLLSDFTQLDGTPCGKLVKEGGE